MWTRELRDFNETICSVYIYYIYVHAQLQIGVSIELFCLFCKPVRCKYYFVNHAQIFLTYFWEHFQTSHIFKSSSDKHVQQKIELYSVHLWLNTHSYSWLYGLQQLLIRSWLLVAIKLCEPILHGLVFIYTTRIRER